MTSEREGCKKRKGAGMIARGAQMTIKKDLCETSSVVIPAEAGIHALLIWISAG